MVCTSGRYENEHGGRAGKLALLVMIIADNSHKGELCETSTSSGGAGFAPRDNDGEGKLVVAHGPPGVLEHEWTARKNCFVDRSPRVPRARPATFVFQARTASKFRPQISRRPSAFKSR